MENWHLKSAHSRHLWVNVQRVQVSAQPVEDGLIALRLLLLEKIWLSIGRLWDGGLYGTLVTKTSHTAHEKSCPDSGLQLSCLSLQDASVYNHKSTFALILQIRQALFDDIASAMHQGLLKSDLLLTMQDHHGVERGHTWDIKIAACKLTSMAKGQRIGRESLEPVCVLIREFEMV